MSCDFLLNFNHSSIANRIVFYSWYCYILWCNNHCCWGLRWFSNWKLKLVLRQVSGIKFLSQMSTYLNQITSVKWLIQPKNSQYLPLTSPRIESILEWGKWSTSLKRSFFGKFGSKSKSVSLKSFKIACDTICSRCSGWKSIRLKEN